MSRLYVAMDTETGDLIPSKGDLLTVYIGIFDEDFKLIDELDLKTKPNEGRFPIANWQALKVNGIDLQSHLNNPDTLTYKEANLKVMTMLKKYLKKNGKYSNLIPMAYNYDFDCKWLQHYLISEEEWNSVLHYGKIDPKMCVDFLKNCKWVPQDLGSLSSVAEYFKVPKRHAHTAKDDTLMMVDIYKSILDIMKAKKDDGQTQDLITLLESE